METRRAVEVDIEPRDQWLIAFATGAVLFFPVAFFRQETIQLGMAAGFALDVLGLIGLTLMVFSAFHAIVAALGGRKKA